MRNIRIFVLGKSRTMQFFEDQSTQAQPIAFATTDRSRPFCEHQHRAGTRIVDAKDWFTLTESIVAPLRNQWARLSRQCDTRLTQMATQRRVSDSTLRWFNNTALPEFRRMMDHVLKLRSRLRDSGINTDESESFTQTVWHDFFGNDRQYYQSACDTLHEAPGDFFAFYAGHHGRRHDNDSHNLGGIFEQATTKLALQAVTAGVRIETVGLDRLQVTTPLARRAMEALFYNLVQNGLRHGRLGNPHAAARSTASQSHTMLLMAVNPELLYYADTGPGLPLALLITLCDPYLYDLAIDRDFRRDGIPAYAIEQPLRTGSENMQRALQTLGVRQTYVHALYVTGTNIVGKEYFPPGSFGTRRRPPGRGPIGEDKAEFAHAIRFNQEVRSIIMGYAPLSATNSGTRILWRFPPSVLQGVGG